MIDSHCHLDFDCFTDLESTLAACKDAGVDHCVVPATTASSWQKIIQISQTHGMVSYAFGLHPYFVNQHSDADLHELSKFVTRNRPAAIGEIGLDYFDDRLDKARQHFLFEEQVKIAIEHELPLILHVRKANDQVFSLLRKLRFEKGGIVHAFSGSLQQAQRFLDLGFVLGFGGASTYSRAKRLHSLIRDLPLDAIVLETDSPDMAPSFARGEINSPANLPEIAALIAAEKPVEVQTLIDASDSNVKRVLGFA